MIHATATDSDGEIYSCDTQETIVPAMTDSNLRQQHQCQDTSFLVEPLLSKIGYMANTQAAQDIINDCFDIPAGTNPYATELIGALAIPDSIRALGLVPFHISLEENTMARKSQKEQTGSEPSSPSFAQFKCCAMTPELNSINTLLRTVPLHLGFSPHMW